jgi:hypothetical protein
MGVSIGEFKSYVIWGTEETNRPNTADKLFIGKPFFDTDEGPIWWVPGTGWIDALGNVTNVDASTGATYNENTLDRYMAQRRANYDEGHFDERPDDEVFIGKAYFDASIQKPVWWCGDRWILADGSEPAPYEGVTATDDIGDIKKLVVERPEDGSGVKHMFITSIEFYKESDSRWHNRTSDYFWTLVSGTGNWNGVKWNLTIPEGGQAVFETKPGATWHLGMRFEDVSVNGYVGNDRASFASLGEGRSIKVLDQYNGSMVDYDNFAENTALDMTWITYSGVDPGDPPASGVDIDWAVMPQTIDVTLGNVWRQIPHLSLDLDTYQCISLEYVGVESEGGIETHTWSEDGTNQEDIALNRLKFTLTKTTEDPNDVAASWHILNGYHSSWLTAAYFFGEGNTTTPYNFKDLFTESNTCTLTLPYGEGSTSSESGQAYKGDLFLSMEDGTASGVYTTHYQPYAKGDKFHPRQIEVTMGPAWENIAEDTVITLTYVRDSYQYYDFEGANVEAPMSVFSEDGTMTPNSSTNRLILVISTVDPSSGYVSVWYQNQSYTSAWTNITDISMSFGEGGQGYTIQDFAAYADDQNLNIDGGNWSGILTESPNIQIMGGMFKSIEAVGVEGGGSSPPTASGNEVSIPWAEDMPTKIDVTLGPAWEKIPGMANDFHDYDFLTLEYAGTESGGEGEDLYIWSEDGTKEYGDWNRLRLVVSNPTNAWHFANFQAYNGTSSAWTTAFSLSTEASNNSAYIFRDMFTVSREDKFFWWESNGEGGINSYSGNGYMFTEDIFRSMEDGTVSGTWSTRYHNGAMDYNFEGNEHFLPAEIEVTIGTSWANIAEDTVMTLKWVEDYHTLANLHGWARYATAQVWTEDGTMLPSNSNRLLISIDMNQYSANMKIVPAYLPSTSWMNVGSINIPGELVPWSVADFLQRATYMSSQIHGSYNTYFWTTSGMIDIYDGVFKSIEGVGGQAFTYQGEGGEGEGEGEGGGD